MIGRKEGRWWATRNSCSVKRHMQYSSTVYLSNRDPNTTLFIRLSLVAANGNLMTVPKNNIHKCIVSHDLYFNVNSIYLKKKKRHLI